MRLEDYESCVQMRARCHVYMQTKMKSKPNFSVYRIITEGTTLDFRCTSPTPR